MKIELWPVDRLKAYEGNPRNNDEAVESVAASIREYGFRQPIVVDRDGVIVAGHTRFRAAKLLDLATVPVHVAADLTEQQARAYRLADNRTSELATWDFDSLARELQELQAGGALAGVGWTNEEIGRMIDSLTPENPKNADEGQAFDESAADEVAMLMCPHCGKSFPQ